MNDNISVEDLKSFKKKYIGARLDPEKVKAYNGATINPEQSSFNFRYSYLDSGDGDEFTYEFDAVIDKNCVIKKLYAPHCFRLRGDNIRGSSYSGKRMDDDDYWNVDMELEELLAEDE